MNRRDVLLGVAVAGGSVLAGCSSLGGDGSGTDVRARIDAAIEYLEANDDELDELEGDDPPDSFDAASIRDRADDAEAELDEAEGSASSDQQTVIDVLRATASFQREAGVYGELVVSFHNCLDTVDSYIANNEWQQASDELESCTTTLSDLDDQLDDTIAALEAVDTERLASETGIEYDEPPSELRLARDELDAASDYMEGLERFVDGVAHWMDGQEPVDNENWAVAASTFEDARSDFEASATTLRALEDDADTPEDFLPDVVELRCTAEAFADASDEMALGANDADRENYGAASDHFDAAEAALERCQ